MNTQTIPIDQLTPDPANVRLHDSRNLEAIKNSLARFGQQKPIVVDKFGVVLAGNGTLAAARMLGWKEIAIIQTNLVGVEATAYAIADNRSAELASWDDPALARTLAALKLEDESLYRLLDFDDSEIPSIPEDDEPIGLPPVRQLVVECDDEESQRELYDRLTKEGFKCRVSTL